MNFENAIRGLRNPLESWHKSDSKFGIDNIDSTLDFDIAFQYCLKEDINDEDANHFNEMQEKYAEWLRKNGILKWDEKFENFEFAYIGPYDLELAHKMIKAGSSDRKFLRQIFVSVDITAPLYWWKQADTYKIGTVANSTSTMHKLATTPITINCFEIGDYNKSLIIRENHYQDKEGFYSYFVDDFSKNIIANLEQLRLKYLETKDKKYWKELVRWLPNGWLQTRTLTMNYEVLRNIYFQRKHHKLQEWHLFCQWIEDLPYSADLITYN